VLEQVAIRTATHSYEPRRLGGSELIEAVQSAKAELGPGGAVRLASIAIEDRNRLGTGFQVWDTAEAINGLPQGREVPAVAERLDGLEKNTFVELVSLVTSNTSEAA
jgi:hypothetical protein